MSAVEEELKPPIVKEYYCCVEINGEKIEILSILNNGDVILEGEKIANYLDIAKRIKE